MISIYGFTLLRNGIKYDYSFKESLTSLLSITKSTFLALGDSEDETEKSLLDLNLNIRRTLWDDSLKEGAIILSQQTNIALDFLRESHGQDEKAWGIYLQCDEVFHEDDYQLIKKDLQKAHDLGCDAMTFRYLHFWKDHHSLAINKKWYPHEIRAIKIKTNICSWGDAQSFQNYSKLYHSEARVFHYGHVREEESYKKKKKDILTLYHPDNLMKKYRRREKRFDDLTECIPYFGTHPEVMRQRIEKMGDTWILDQVEDAHILGRESHFSPELVSRIHAKRVHFYSTISDAPRFIRSELVIVAPHFFQRLWVRSFVPLKMRSKLARVWSFEFVLTLKLSERGITLK